MVILMQAQTDLFSGLSVVGTQDAIACIANNEINNSRVVNTEAVDSVLKVWVECDENA